MSSNSVWRPTNPRCGARYSHPKAKESFHGQSTSKKHATVVEYGLQAILNRTPEAVIEDGGPAGLLSVLCGNSDDVDVLGRPDGRFRATIHEDTSGKKDQLRSELADLASTRLISRMVTRTVPPKVLNILREEVGYHRPADKDGDICGSPYLTWHHFDPPWRVKKHHRPEGMIALCREHADKADNRSYTDDQLRTLKKEGKGRGKSVSGRFDWMRQEMIAVVGGNAFLDAPEDIIVQKGGVNRSCGFAPTKTVRKWLTSAFHHCLVNH
ncbi:hypothetical protein [Arthrobacter sp. efr-133-R2A-120]|uniref:hypothetical protein n=1 Tax=Arthrobacter sp. efr-133-R2A-120 TaxID=3040277 RepID=UPI00254C8886|nr:hypothetical protein [Arthrobacter sp. efr-133-R2A-120]